MKKINKFMPLIACSLFVTGIASCAKKTNNVNASTVINPSTSTNTTTSVDPSNPDVPTPPKTDDEIYEYEFDYRKQVTIKGLKDPSATELIIPKTINGMKVAKLYGSSLENVSNVKKIIFEDTSFIDSATAISYAFRKMYNLESIEFAPGVSNVRGTNVWLQDNCLFYKNYLILGCRNSIIPTDFTSTAYLVAGAFSGSVPQRLVISKNISLYYYDNVPIFSYTKELKEIVATEDSNYKVVNNCLIGKDDGVIHLGCETSTIPLDPSVTKIGDFAFYGSSIKRISIPSNILQLYHNSTKYQYAFAYSDLEEITFADGSTITNLGNGTFTATKLKEIRIPNGVTSLSGNVFNFCSELTTIKNLKDDLTIDYGRFIKGCSSLKNLLGTDGNPSTNFIYDNGLIINKKAKKVLSYNGTNESVTIPDDITVITDSAFAYNKTIKHIEFNNVTAIEAYAFQGSTLETMGSVSKLSAIGLMSFSNCHLKEVKWDNTRQFTNYPFYNSTIDKFILAKNSNVSSYKWHQSLFYNLTIGEIELEEGIDSNFYLYENQLLYKEINSSTYSDSVLGIFGDISTINIKEPAQGKKVNIFYLNATTNDKKKIKHINLPSMNVQMFNNNAVFHYLDIDTLDLSNWDYTDFGGGESKFRVIFNSNIKNLILPKGVNAIATNAIDSSFIENLTIPDTVVTMYDSMLKDTYVKNLNFECINYNKMMNTNYTYLFQSSNIDNFKFNGTVSQFKTMVKGYFNTNFRYMDSNAIFEFKDDSGNIIKYTKKEAASIF